MRKVILFTIYSMCIYSFISLKSNAQEPKKIDKLIFTFPINYARTNTLFLKDNSLSNIKKINSYDLFGAQYMLSSKWGLLFNISYNKYHTNNPKGISILNKEKNKNETISYEGNNIETINAKFGISYKLINYDRIYMELLFEYGWLNTSWKKMDGSHIEINISKNRNDGFDVYKFNSAISGAKSYYSYTNAINYKIKQSILSLYGGISYIKPGEVSYNIVNASSFENTRYTNSYELPRQIGFFIGFSYKRVLLHFKNNTAK